MESRRLVTSVLSSAKKQNSKIKSRLLASLVGLAAIIGSLPAVEAAANVAGFTPGEFSVDQSGGAGYTLPIGIPAGVAGMQPELSINYSSGDGNGLLGVGFSLSGLSAITRCGRTIVQDGAVGGVELTDNDRFCLSGQRLVAVSGEYGQSGTEYRTEINSFARITSYGRQGNGPAWFSIETKSGQTIEFGNSEDSRIEAQGKSSAFVWAQNRLVDAVGNDITITYQENNANTEYYPLRIDYSDNSVRFEYEEKEYTWVSYLAGSSVKSTKRMSKVNTWHDENKLGEYRFTFESRDNKPALLTTIQQCDGGNNCFPATTVDWQQPGEGFGEHLLTSNICANGSTANGVCNDGDNFNAIRFLDLNKDGKSDLIYRGDQGMTTFLSTGTGFEFAGTSGICANGSGSYGACNDSDNHQYIYYPDINGDATPDLCYRSDSGIKCFLGHGDGTWGEYISTDICSNSSQLYGGCNGPSNYGSIRFIDLNLDGKDDIAFRSDSGLRTLLSTGTGFTDYGGNNACADGSGEYGSCNGSNNHPYIWYPDINGDAFVDVCFRSDQGINCFKGDGAGDWGEYFSTDICANGSTANGVCNDGDNFDAIQFLDLNQDGKSDLVYRGDQGMTTFLSTGTGFELARTSGICANGSANYGACNDSDNHQYIFYPDINGDAIPDLCYRGDQGIQCHIGNGSGGWAQHIATNICANGSTANGVCNDGDNFNAIRFLDLNKDGKSDLVYRGDQGMSIFLSTGTGFEFAGTSGICANGSGSYGACNDGDNHQYIFYPDINGDGQPDLVYRGDSGIQGWMQQDHTLPLIRMVDDGITQTHINYQPLTQGQIHTLETDGSYPTLDLQIPLYVVTEVQTPDGLGGVNTSNYRYGGLKFHLHGRGSLGFAWMESTDQQTGIKTKTTYHQAFPFTGQVATTEQHLADNTLLGRTEVTWIDESSYDNKVHHIYTEQTLDKKHDLDGTLLATTTTDNIYDAFGNPTQITVITEDSLGTETKDTLSDYTNNTDLWHLGRLTRATVTHSRGSAQESITRTSSFEYNADGLLSREIIEPDKLEYRKQTDTDYDSYGNKIQVTTSGQGITTRSASTQYSPDGRFPISVTNALEHGETRTYDPLLGVMTSLTGPNGLTTTWEYDSFGRKIREDRADGTWSTIYRGMCGITDCPDDAPLGTVLYTTTQSAGSTPTTTYSNKLGQVTRKVTIGFDGTPVYQESEYNARGQVSRSSLPYFKGEASHWSESEYDILGRPIKVTQQGPNGSTIENSFSYSGFTTTVTNAKGHIKTTQKNAQGKVVRVDEEEGGWVTYQYDAIGNLLETNANGVITTLTYDTLGRHKTAMDDPDMGQWSYQYDILGNLISQTDAKNQTVTQTYDLLGRMIERVEPEGTTTWTYDTAANGIGKLAQITAPSNYLKTLTYDSLGRAKSDTTAAAWMTATTTNEYDSFSRVSKETRPQGFVVENVYNEQGYLKAIRTPEAQIGDYDALHLSQKWDEIQPQLEQELQEAQAQADLLGAQAAVYRARATVYYQTAEQLREEAPNKAFLEEDRKQTIASLQQSAASLNALADQLEQKAAEYQQLADAILSMMPTDWQQSWFISAKARYDNYARDAIQKIESAYQTNLTAPLVWIPIQVGDITIFVKGKPGFSGRSAITDKEADHLQSIAEWEAGTAGLLRQLAEDARAQQQARDKFDTAVANHPDLVWVPIDVDGITTFIQVAPESLTPASVLTQEELDAYNAPDYLEADGIALAEHYTQQVEVQQTRQRQIESYRNDYARTASRLTQNSVAYSTMESLLQGGSGEITFWRATGRDAAGRLTAGIVGNGLETQKHYDQATGQLMSISSGFGAAEPTRLLMYQYDSLNNVSSRIDHIQGLSEDFQYDRMDRLTQSYVSGQIGEIAYDNTLDYSYDARGNILNKSDIGDYLYGDQDRTTDNAGPHALLSAGLTHTGYQYDANGNMTSGGGRTIKWTSFNKPRKFTKGTTNVWFHYGADRKRTRKQTQMADGTTAITNYFGNIYERVKTDDKTEYKHFIYADGQLVAMHIKAKEQGTWAKLPDQTRYLHRDALGSIDTITDGKGNIVERMSYEPFGERRGGDWRVGTGLSVIPAFTNRGFTGHEHVDEMDLIHMNGRVYDPSLGRFLSADPNIQAPYNSQSYNRYSYALNNPLKYTDPSGYFFKALFKALDKIHKIFSPVTYAIQRAVEKVLVKNNTLRAIGQIVAGIYGGPWGAAAYSARMTYLMGGSNSDIFKAAALTYASAALAYEVGHGVGEGWGSWEKAFAHGVTQGSITAARGGKFKEGFLGGFVGHAIGGRLKGWMPDTIEGRTVAAAVAGGVASVAGGGKFANGAVSAAFVHLFNHELSNLTHNVKAGDDPRLDPAVMRESRAVGLSLNDWCHNGEGGECDLKSSRYPMKPDGPLTADEAAFRNDQANGVIGALGLASTIAGKSGNLIIKWGGRAGGYGVRYLSYKNIKLREGDVIVSGLAVKSYAYRIDAVVIRRQE